MTIILYIILITFSASMTFLFSGIEAGVFCLNRLRVRQQIREGNKKAKILSDYFREPEKFYWTILLGNTLSNTSFVIILIFLLKEISTDFLFWVLFLVGIFTFFTCCDLLPKTLFRKFPNRLCIIVAQPFRIIQLTLSPFVYIVHIIFGNAFGKSVVQPLANKLFRNREELKSLMEESDECLSTEERIMIKQVLHLSERTIGQIAIPLNLCVTASSDSMISDVIKLFRINNISRIPIWKFTGGQRRVIGITTLKTSLYREDYYENNPVSCYLQSALFLPANLKIEAALQRMQRSGHWLAIVTSETQSEAGIVALQDILKVVLSERPK